MCSWCFSKNMIHCTECHGFQELLPKQDETGRWAGDFSSPAGEGVALGLGPTFWETPLLVGVHSWTGPWCYQSVTFSA